MLLHVRVVEARGLAAGDRNGKSDPYCVLKMKRLRDDSEVLRSEFAKAMQLKVSQRTSVRPRTLDPVWNEYFTLPFADFTEFLSVSVYDRDRLSRDDFLGRLRVDMADLQARPEQHEWLPLFDKRGERRVRGQLNLKICASTVPQLDLERGAKLARVAFDSLVRRRLDFASRLERGLDLGATLAICVATWNVGNAAPPADLREWLPAAPPQQQRRRPLPVRTYDCEEEEEEEDEAASAAAAATEKEKQEEVARAAAAADGGDAAPEGEEARAPAVDVFVVASQECRFDAGAGAAKDAWQAAVQRCLGDEFALVAQSSLWEIRLLVFVRAGLREAVDWAETGSVATGFGNVLGNKGCAAVSLSVMHTSFCFVSAHLAAHQNESARRNAQVMDIWGSLALGHRNVDALSQFHHVFFVGDLNYRLQPAPRVARRPSPELFRCVCARVESGELQALFDSDQLQRQARLGRVFSGFCEIAPPPYPPTFKLARPRAHSLAYDAKRLPAWTDRVLWRSAPGFGAQLSPLSAHAAASVTTSDHTPVAACFAVRATLSASGVDERRGACSVRLVDLRAHLSGGADKEGLRRVLTQISQRSSAGQLDPAAAAAAAAAAPPPLAHDSDEEEGEEDAVNASDDAIAVPLRKGDESDPPLPSEALRLSVDPPPAQPPPAASEWSPYIKFSGPCLAGSVTTAVKRRTSEPAWNNAREVPPLVLTMNSKERLHNELITVRVLSHESLLKNSDPIIAQGVLSLAPLADVAPSCDRWAELPHGIQRDGEFPRQLWQSAAFPVRVPLELLGVRVGTLECTVHVHWEPLAAPGADAAGRRGVRIGAAEFRELAARPEAAALRDADAAEMRVVQRVAHSMRDRLTVATCTEWTLSQALQLPEEADDAALAPPPSHKTPPLLPSLDAAAAPAPGPAAAGDESKEARRVEPRRPAPLRLVGAAEEERARAVPNAGTPLFPPPSPLPRPVSAPSSPSASPLRRGSSDDEDDDANADQPGSRTPRL